jgi:hypothetical protein
VSTKRLRGLAKSGSWKSTTRTKISPVKNIRNLRSSTKDQVQPSKLVYYNSIIIVVCYVTLSVYPHRASMKNMPDHGGVRGSIPKAVGSIPTVVGHVFHACPVWIYTQSNKHHIHLSTLHQHKSIIITVQQKIW